MDTKSFLKKVAHIADSDIPDDNGKVYLSNFDDSYITRVGMEDSVMYLASREITEQLSNGVGYSPKDNKWYGWSHRAIYGFTIGSTCKKGDCHYNPVSKEDFISDAINFWEDTDSRIDVSATDAQEEILETVPIEFPTDPSAPIPDHEWKPTGRFRDGVRIEWTYTTSIPNEKLRGTKSGTFIEYPDKFGRGEWTAETMEDAKQMAIDFNEGVS